MVIQAKSNIATTDFHGKVISLNECIDKILKKSLLRSNTLLVEVLVVLELKLQYSPSKSAMQILIFHAILQSIPLL